MAIMKKKKDPVNRFRHIMSGVTSTNKSHAHLFENVSDVVILLPGTHMHTFSGITTTQNGHRHTYSGTTGPSINGTGPHGGGPNHSHRFTITFKSADGHTHTVTGTTTVTKFIGNSKP